MTHRLSLQTHAIASTIHEGRPVRKHRNAPLAESPLREDQMAKHNITRAASAVQRFAL